MKQSSDLQTIVLILDSKKYYIFKQPVDQPITADFPPEALSDLSITNEVMLAKQFSELVVSHQLARSEVIIVLLDSLLFSQEIPSLDSDQQQAISTQFLKSVPFLHIEAKSYQTASGIKIIAYNKDFYVPVIRSLQQAGLRVSLMLPYFTLLNTVAGTIPSVEQISQLITSKLSYIPYTLLQELPQEQDEAKIKKYTEIDAPNSNTRLIVLSVLFIISLAILGLIAYFTYFAQ